MAVSTARGLDKLDTNSAKNSSFSLERDRSPSSVHAIGDYLLRKTPRTWLGYHQEREPATKADLKLSNSSEG